MKKCRLCQSNNLETLVSFKDYPVFIGCADTPIEQDDVYDFEVYYCNDCHFIQQIDTPPLDILYRELRAFGLGRTWKEHYDRFFEFIRDNSSNESRILEVGGGNGVMLEKFIAEGCTHLTDIEPSPQYNLEEVNTVKKYLDGSLTLEYEVDVVYASHLIEHVLDLDAFFENVANILTDGGSLFTACPNIVKSFENMHLNAFTTDHFNYFSPEVLKNLAAKYGLYVKNNYQFRDHGMYFQFVKQSEVIAVEKHEEVYKLFKKYEKKIIEFAEYINNQNLDKYYVFAAHAFTITFLRYLGSDKKVINVLDNEPTKINRRLSGTNLLCKPPETISKEDKPTIIVYMGAYTKEICEQLIKINPDVNLVRLDEFVNKKGTNVD